MSVSQDDPGPGGMEIDEDQFRKLPKAERDVVIFRNTRVVAKSLRVMRFHQIIQDLCIAGLGTVMGFIAAKVF